MMKIGFSLYTDLLLENKQWKRKKEWSLNFTSSADILHCLRAEGVTSIELKLPAVTSARELILFLETLNNFGFHYTFHAPVGMDYPGQFAEFSRQLREIAKITEQEFGRSSFFVLHGLSCAASTKPYLLNLTKEFLLRTQATLAETNFEIILEVLRESADNGKVRAGTSYAEILELLRHRELERVGICWDFGHSFAQAEHGIHSRIPPDEFLQRVKHTHVHDYKNETTHIPLGNGALPYQDYIQRLVRQGFAGIFNLELNPGRISDPENFKTYIVQSIRLLKLVLSGTKPG
jgi:sugar phosphate isomerase/epimerase